MKRAYKFAACGGLLAGIANGLFGTGGGMLLLPILASHCTDRPRAHATCLCVMLVLSAVSAIFYAMDGAIAFSLLWPYLLGGLGGGCMGALLLHKIPPKLLRRGFGLAVLAAGVRLLML